MRILIVNTAERIGGAAIASNRLLGALRSNGIKARMLVRDKQTDSISVYRLKKNWWHVWQFLWERIVIWCNNLFHRQNLFAVDIANTGTDITARPEFKQADLIHLHWINQGMLGLNDLRRILASGKPVVWTMHDMWPCTAICHHARECNRYYVHCHHCPYLFGGGWSRDLSYRTYKKKLKVYSRSPITFVTCSRWLQERAGHSALLKGKEIMCIPNPIDTALFKPADKGEARRRRGLPADKKLMLFGSVKITDKRKGIDYFIRSCQLLAERQPELCGHLGIVVYGRQSEQLIPLVPFKVYPLDYIADEDAMVDVYNAVDVYVTPSLEENLPNTIMEAMACGVPCVGFRVGGIPEMIDHRHAGYVAEYRSVQDFAAGIAWILGMDSSSADYAGLCRAARQKVLDEYALDVVAQQYIGLYNSKVPF